MYKVVLCDCVVHATRDLARDRVFAKGKWEVAKAHSDISHPTNTPYPVSFVPSSVISHPLSVSAAIGWALRHPACCKCFLLQKQLIEDYRLPKEKQGIIVYFFLLLSIRLNYSI